MKLQSIVFPFWSLWFSRLQCIRNVLTNLSRDSVHWALGEYGFFRHDIIPRGAGKFDGREAVEIVKVKLMCTATILSISHTASMQFAQYFLMQSFVFLFVPSIIPTVRLAAAVQQQKYTEHKRDRICVPLLLFWNARNNSGHIHCRYQLRHRLVRLFSGDSKMFAADNLPSPAADLFYRFQIDTVLVGNIGQGNTTFHTFYMRCETLPFALQSIWIAFCCFCHLCFSIYSLATRPGHTLWCFELYSNAEKVLVLQYLLLRAIEWLYAINADDRIHSATVKRFWVSTVECNLSRIKWIRLICIQFREWNRSFSVFFG